MQALFLISLGATCLGGAIALGALFCRFSVKPSRAGVGKDESRGNSSRSDRDSGVKLDELERRERSFSALCKRANDELDAKRQALEALTRRADEAAEALGRALDSVSFAFGTNANSLRRDVGNRAFDSAAPFELNDFDFSSPMEQTRCGDARSFERQAKAA